MSANPNPFNVHLVSDSTGETITTLSRACLAQFEDIRVCENVWPLVRTEGQINRILTAVEDTPGIVLFSIVDEKVRGMLEKGCRDIGVPFIPILDPVLSVMRSYFHAEATGKPGLQHVMDADYFNRIEAMHYTIAHDDGQSVFELEKADIIIVGVSRTSKTPTSIYLANRGLKVCNIPIVPQCPLPVDLADPKFQDVLIVGLTKDPKSLVQIRKNRLNMIQETTETDYADLESVAEEVKYARRLCARNQWPVLDVSRKSIEETASSILQLLQRRASQASAAS